MDKTNKTFANLSFHRVDEYGSSNPPRLTATSPAKLLDSSCKDQNFYKDEDGKAFVTPLHAKFKTYSNRSPGQTRLKTQGQPSTASNKRPVLLQTFPSPGNVTAHKGNKHNSFDDFTAEQQEAWADQCEVEVDLPDEQNPFVVLKSFLKKPDHKGFAYLLPYIRTGKKQALECAYNPYCFRVVPYIACTGPEYYTLSSAGITQFAHGVMEDFVTLKQWKRERSIFHALIRMSVFKTYRWWKPIRLWKHLVKFGKFVRISNMLEERHLATHTYFQTGLVALRSLWLQLEENSPTLFPTLEQGDNEIMLREFSDDQSRRARKVIDRVKNMWLKSIDLLKSNLLNFTGEFSQSVLIKNTSSDTLNNSQNVQDSTMNPAKDTNEAKPPKNWHDAEDTSQHPMQDTTTKEAKICKTQYAALAFKRMMQHKIFRFTKLCDLIIVDCLHTFSIASVEALYRRFDPASKWCIPIIPTSILFIDHELCLSPDGEEFLQEIEGIASNCLNCVCTGFSLVTNIDLRSFWTLHDAIVTSKDPVQDAVCFDRNLKTRLDSILNFTKQIYKQAASIVDELKPHLQIYVKSESFDFSSIVQDAEEKFARTFPKMLEMIKGFEGQRDSLSGVPEFFDCCILQLVCTPFKVELEKYPARCISRVHDVIIAHFNKKQSSLSSLLMDASASVSLQGESLDSFVKLRTVSLGYEDRVPRLESEIEELMNHLTTARCEGVPISEELSDDCILLLPKMNKLKRNIDEANEIFVHKQNYWRDILEAEICVFAMQIPEIKKKIEDPRLLDTSIDRFLEVKQLDERIAKCQEKVSQFAECSVVLKRDVDDFSELEDLAVQARLRLQLWEIHRSIRRDFESTRDLPLEQLHLDLWKENAHRWPKFILRAEKEVPSGLLVKAVKAQTQQYIRVVDFCTHLMNPVMKQRHWEILFAQTGHRLNPHRAYIHHKAALNDVVDDGLLTVGQILSILDDPSHAEQGASHASEEATKQNELEIILDQIKDLWSKKEFNFAPYSRSEDMLLLWETDELQRALDESILSLSAILASQHSEPIRADIETTMDTLQRLKLYIEEWMDLQKYWVHLDPIFSSPDIQRQLPGEARQFLVIATEVKNVAKRGAAAPNCIKLSSAGGQRELFVQLRHGFERIKRSLQDYLEAKRMAFPRFYFLADDELIHMLSQTRNIQVVQEHISKCFQGVKSFSLGLVKQARRHGTVFLNQNVYLSPGSMSVSHNVDIKGIVSKEDEHILFDSALKVRGDIEHWLLAFEKKLTDSLRQEAKSAVHASTASSLPAQEDDGHPSDRHPSQILILRQQILWCKGTEHAILQQHESTSADELHNWRALHRESLLRQCTRLGEEIDDLQRAKLSSVLTIEVHHRDLLAKIHQKRISELSDFEWQMCMRYYWLQETGECQIRQIAACFYYTFEYWGATTRLVVTALTDKCYMTLTSALHLTLGGAPFGPAGTGKTETTKDLAKSFGRQCIVFNCADNLDTYFMRKFFMGLAQCGAWTCLDEFNRINVDVLSVVAQLIISLQLALRSKVEKMEFEGKTIKILNTLGIFVTMNPGSSSNSGESYAGRSDLPDNLKALFRPCAMMIPDFEPVAEVMLFVQGFHEAHVLAKTLVDLYRISSEQLSQARHYDFGMRAIKSLLVMAGARRRIYPAASEESVLYDVIRDCNLPKFTKSDALIFVALMADLQISSNSDDGCNYANTLMNKVHAHMINAGFQPVPTHSEKVLQLLVTLPIRFGVLALGLCDTGKTAMVTLAASMEEDQNLEGMKKTKLFCINPKSISPLELYGCFVNSNKEWKEGLSAYIFREQPGDNEDNSKWIVFDGPIDTVWIENMNTVLDDNECLCLSNGERIQLDSARMRIIFEVDDLSFASPATISRLGIIFLSLDVLQPLAVMTSILQKDLSISLSVEVQNRIQDLFAEALTESLNFVRKECKEDISSSDNNMARSFCNIFTAIFEDIISEPKSDALPPLIFSEDNCPFEILVKDILLFSLAWSVGANTDEIGQEKFDKWVQERVYLAQFGNSNEKLHDFFVDPKTCRVAHFQALIPEYVYDSKVKITDFMIPTIDTIRYSHILEVLALHGREILFHGPSGGGRSMFIRDKAKTLVTAEKVLSSALLFSAQVSSSRIQEVLEGQLERKTKGIASPPLGKKLLVVVDDINMPQHEHCGAQPPIELLRQAIGHVGIQSNMEMCGYGGLYDRSNWRFYEIHNVVFVASCCDTHGQLTSRFTRHFNMIHVSPPSPAVLRAIFFSLLDGHLQSFNMDVQDLCKPTIDATIHLHEQMLVELVRTPAKFHYSFNIRDIARIIQGMIFVRSEDCTNPHTFVKLWIHEVQRVYQDRLTDVSDVERLCQGIHQLLRSRFKLRWTFEAVFAEPILFGDFFKPDSPPNDRRYVQIDNHSKLLRVAQHYLDEYNRMSSKTMDLVLYKEALGHIARLTRILRFPQGHAMLVGVAGCGKQSAARLASYIAGHQCFQIQTRKGYKIMQFREDVKKLFWIAGVDMKSVVFLIDDSDILEEDFLDLVNSMLSSGQVQDLFSPPEHDKIIAEVNRVCRERKIPTGGNTMQLFQQIVRENLHIIISLTPVGDTLRNRCRTFPALLNCCAMDWYLPWPSDAFRTVADGIFVSSFKLLDPSGGNLPITEDNRKALAQVSVQIHHLAEEHSQKFNMEFQRHYYLSPKIFVDFIETFLQTVTEKVLAIIARRERFANGISKMGEATSTIELLRKEVEDLKPVLEEKQLRIQELLLQVSIDKDAANAAREKVEKETEIVEKQAAKVALIREDAQRDLDHALPILQSAIVALNSLTRTDIVEVKSFLKPPLLVQVVMEAVCTLLKEPISWESSRRVLGNTGFMERLLTYDKDSIDHKVIQNLKKYIDNPEFVPEQVGKVSKAARGLCMWCRAIDVYAAVAKEVQPKRMRLKAADNDLANSKILLRIQCTKLNEASQCVEGLEKRLGDAQDELASLQNQMAICENRLNRSTRLTSALGEELQSWSKATSDCNDQLQRVVGDALICSAYINYCSPFNTFYRISFAAMVLQMCTDTKLEVSAPFVLRNVLTTDAEILSWGVDGLPSDPQSIDNGIIIARCRRWPLVIDPQMQASKWLKRSMERAGMKPVHLDEDNWLRSLESGIRGGATMVIENVGVELDPSLMPILQKQITEQSGHQYIRFGEIQVEYDKNFRLVMTTKISNPHIISALSNFLTVVNFICTPNGIEEQVLSDVVRKERPELEQSREKLIMSMANDQKLLDDLQSRILVLLDESDGVILDNEHLVTTLLQSQQTSNIILHRFKDAMETEAHIAAARNGYRDVAKRASILYFTMAELPKINTMYQYSLQDFKQIYMRFISSQGTLVDTLEEYVGQLVRGLTNFVVRYVSHGLFESHRLMFAFFVCIAIDRNVGAISDVEWSALLAKSNHHLSSYKDGKFVRESFESHLESARMIEDLLPNSLNGFALSFQNDPSWLLWIQSNDPVHTPIPFPDLTDCGKLILFKTFHEDKLIHAIKSFVSGRLELISQSSFVVTLHEIFPETSNAAPIIILLSTGSDPTHALLQYFDETYTKSTGTAKANSEEDLTVHCVSMGQGQGSVAERIVPAAAKRGDWVCLSNIHLAGIWMPSLERMVEELTLSCMKSADTFRLWLTSMPMEQFSASVLGRGYKIVCEAAKGLRANLQSSLIEVGSVEWDSYPQTNVWTRLLTGLSFFHAVANERKKFGPVGWNESYDFDKSDFFSAKSIMKLFVDQYEKMPWDALRYITGHIIYGGRVTDDLDQRCLSCLITRFYCDAIISEEGHKINGSKAYRMGPSSAFQDILTFVQGLPDDDEVDVFGLDQNSNYVLQRKEAGRFLQIVKAIQPLARQCTDESVNRSPDNGEVVNQIDKLLSSLPNIEPSGKTKDVLFLKPPLELVLEHEMERYSHLLDVMRATISSCLLSLKGQSVMTAELEETIASCQRNILPRLWASASYSSEKSLSSWFSDLSLRLAFFQQWARRGPSQAIFWLSAFFFPRGFITACLQQYTRFQSRVSSTRMVSSVASNTHETIGEDEDAASTHAREGHSQHLPRIDSRIPLASLAMRFIPMSSMRPESFDILPVQGVYAYGAFLEGAGWDLHKRRLTHSHRGETWPHLPVFHLEPILAADLSSLAGGLNRQSFESTQAVDDKDAGNEGVSANHYVEEYYPCPLYQTTARRGGTSSTGASNNLVLVTPLPAVVPSDVWILRGAAMILQIPD